MLDADGNPILTAPAPAPNPLAHVPGEGGQGMTLANAPALSSAIVAAPPVVDVPAGPSVPAGLPPVGVPVPPAPAAPISPAALALPAPDLQPLAPVPTSPGAGGGGSGGGSSLEKQVVAANKDEQAAARAAQEAQAQKSEALARAQADAQAQHLAQAEEIRQTRAQHAQAIAESTTAANRALEEAHNSKIPDFWAGDEGKLTWAVAASTIGGFASSMLGGPNAAYNIIQHNVDTFYSREKDRIDNLYKYAEARGRMTDQLRLQQAADLSELQVQHGATNIAVADHINEVANQAQGKVDRSQGDVLAAQLKSKGVEGIEKARLNLAQISLMRSQAAEASAKAAAARTDDKQFKELDTRAKSFVEKQLDGTTRSPGPRQQLIRLASMKNELQSAISSGDKSRALTTIKAIEEEAGGMISGGKSTTTSVHLLQGMQTLGDRISSQWGSIAGNPQAGAQYTQQLDSLLSGVADEKRQQVGALVSQFENQELNPTSGLSTSTPAQAERARRHVAGFRGDFAPKVDNGLPAGLPPGSTPAGVTKDGRRAYRLPDGSLVAG